MRYAELHCRSNFSFLQGASHPEELVIRAGELGYAGLAVTDLQTLAGVVRAHTAGRDHGVRTVVGTELQMLDGTFPDGASFVVWPTDRAAYGRLTRLITSGCRRGGKGECRLLWDEFLQQSEGQLIGIVPTPSLRGESFEGEPCSVAEHHYRQLIDQLGDRVYLLASLHAGVNDAGVIERLRILSRRWQVPIVAAGDVLYHQADRQPLHDTLTAIRHGTTVSLARHQLQANAQRHLRSLPELEKMYERVPEWLERTGEILDRIHFSLSDLRYEYPEELAPRGLTPWQYLRDLAWQGAADRYPEGIPDKVRALIEHELQLIDELRYEAYFLTVWDLVQFARSRGILCQGRGSAANSAVCFCLGITAVDPARADVLFERFISRERDEAPDIDVDFEHERREEVLQYLYRKYGRDRAGIAAEVVTYRCRSAVRDVGKALGLSLDRVDALAKLVEHYDRDPQLGERCRQVGIDPRSRMGQQLLSLVDQLIGFPRHLSQHVGGMVMTHGLLCEMVPIENAAMPERTVIQWNKDDLDDLGILKVDCLALGMLSAIRRCLDLLRLHLQVDYQLATIPAEDPHVYDMICAADTMGVFQIESRAQMSMLPRLRPRCFYDLVIEVAIVRPGPIQGQMVHPYLRRRNGEEPVDYPNEAIRDVLHKTMGVPIFQEQAMRLAVVAAGFTPGEADQLRRAMGAWRRPGVIDQFRQKLLIGMRAQGLSDEFAEQVFRQIRGFGEYGFPESHAASFALLVYVSAWLKCHYPEVFVTALLNSQPMGFYAPAQLIRDAKQHGVEIRPVDVNASNWDCTLEALPVAEQSSARDRIATTTRVPTHAIRLGWRLLTGIARRDMETLVKHRIDGGPYQSQADLVRRTGLSQVTLRKLARADALQSLGQHRRQALWDALAQESQGHDLPLFAQLQEQEDDGVVLPPLEEREEVFADYQSVGLSLRQHPLAFYRTQLQTCRTIPLGDLEGKRDGSRVRLAGLVILRQRPSTAKGITFVTLEDETGIANLVVRPQVWTRYYRIARRSAGWIVEGRLQRSENVTHVVVRRLEDLSKTLERLGNSSRDFR